MKILSLNKQVNTEKSSRLLNYSLSLIRYGKSCREEKEQKEWYISAEIKLNNIVKSYSNSSILSDLEMLSLIALTYVKLKLNHFEEAKINLRQLDTLILRCEEQHMTVLPEILKQFKYYFDAKKSILELAQINNPDLLSQNFSSSVSEISYGSQVESYFGISELADELGIK